MADLAGYLDQKLRAAGIPIISVQINDPNVRSQWFIQFAGGVTPQQIADAQALLQSVPVDVTTLGDADANGRLDDKALKAIVLWICQRLSIAPAVARSQILTIYKSL